MRKQAVLDLIRPFPLGLPRIRPLQNSSLEIVGRREVMNSPVIHCRIKIHIISQVNNKSTPVGNTTDDTLITILQKPWKVGPVCLWLCIIEASDGCKGLSS